MMTLVGVFLVAVLGSMILTPVVRAWTRRMGLVAAPKADRWHQQPTALMGGVAIVGATSLGVAALLFFGGGEIVGVESGKLGSTTAGILLSSILMFVVGVADDSRGLRPYTKLLWQAVAAATLIGFGVVYPVFPWPAANLLVTTFWFLALTNALNLLDNMDGAAVGVAAIGALFLAYNFFGQGAYGLSGLCLAVAGAAIGFLPYNFHPASIFMGDSGSLFLGAIIAGLGAAFPATASRSIIPVLVVPILIVIIPLLDTAFVALTRMLAGRSIAVGGRDHTAHRLVGVGLTQRQTALLLYAVACFGGIMATLLLSPSFAFGPWAIAIFLAALGIGAAYLAKIQSYSVGDERPNGKVTILVNNLLYKRRILEVLLDVILFAFAYEMAYLIRWDGNVGFAQREILEATVAIAVAAKLVAFGVLGVYRGTWGQITLADVHRLLMASVLGSLLTVAGVVFIFRSEAFARGIFVIDGLLVMSFATAVRMSFRSLDTMRRALNDAGTRTLIFGAGPEGELAIRQLLASANFDLRPVGFLDADPRKRGVLVHGYPIFGGPKELGRIIQQRKIGKLVIASSELSQDELEVLHRVCHEAKVEVLRLEIGLRPAREEIATLPVERPAWHVSASRY